jgi:hypothetical protein
MSISWGYDYLSLFNNSVFHHEQPASNTTVSYGAVNGYKLEIQLNGTRSLHGLKSVTEKPREKFNPIKKNINNESVLFIMKGKEPCRISFLKIQQKLYSAGAKFPR